MAIPFTVWCLVWVVVGVLEIVTPERIVRRRRSIIDRRKRTRPFDVAAAVDNLMGEGETLYRRVRIVGVINLCLSLATLAVGFVILAAS
jgi:hypothetical protein